MRIFLAVLLLTACGGSATTDLPTTEAHFGYRCLDDEKGDVRCDAPVGQPGIELRCGPENEYWPDYLSWLKTGNVCIGHAPEKPTVGLDTIPSTVL